MKQTLGINLRSSSGRTTEVRLDTGQDAGASFELKAGTYGTAVVKAEWSIDGSQWSTLQDLNGADLSLSDGTKSIRNADVSHVGMVRFYVGTSDSTASEDAEVRILWGKGE